MTCAQTEHFIQVSPRATSSLSRAPSLLYSLLTAGEKKGQTFPPVLHLLETLIKHSERKNRKGKKSHNLSFFCFCCLEGSRKNLVPAEASNTQGQYWATQNSLPKLLTRHTHVLGSVEAQKLFRVTDQRPNRDQSRSLLKPSPAIEMNSFRAKQVQVLV